MDAKSMVRGCAIAAFSAYILGCTTYPEAVRQTKTELLGGAQASYCGASASGGDKLLAWMEQGRLAQLQGHYRQSSDLYRKAISFCDALEEKAVISVGDALDSTLAVMYGNDVTLDYPVVGFERMMLHQLDAINSLAVGDVDGFGVNIRHMERCRGIETTRMKQYQDVINSKLGSEKVEAIASNASYRKFMNDLQRLSPGLRHSTDNAYALFLIALYREAIGDFEDARKYYEEILRILPNNSAATIGLSRCSGSSSVPVAHGEIVVLVEEGFMPEKRTDIVRMFENSSLLPTLYLKVPNYHDADCIPYDDGASFYLLTSQGSLLTRTIPFCDLASLAIKSHEERMKGIIARKVLSAGIMSAMVSAQHWHIHSSNPIVAGVLLVGGVVVDLTTASLVAVSEKTDLRSWLLLPRQVQIARKAVVESGTYNLILKSPHGDKNVPVVVKKGKKTIVYCTSVPGKIECFSSCLDAVK